MSSRPNLDAHDLGMLGALATLMGKEAEMKLASAFKRERGFVVPNYRGKKAFYRVVNGPLENLLHDRKAVETVSKEPIRKEETPGPNVRCPCGSGRKYKMCCGSRVVVNGHRAAVAPAPPKEIDPHIGLTAKRLQTMTLAEALQLDVTRMAPDLQKYYLLYLGIAKQHDGLIELFGRLGVPERLHSVWSHTWRFACDQWRPDLARKLMEVFPNAAEELGVQPHGGIRLLLVGDDPAKFLQELESSIVAALKADDLEEIKRLTGSVLGSPYRGLAILIARSVLPLADENYAADLYDGILELRAKLDLPPDDAFSQWMSEKALRRAHEHDNAAIAEAEEKLRQKTAETRKAAEENRRLERQIKTLKKKETAQKEAKVSTPADEETTRKIRALTADKKHAQELARQRGEAEVEARKALQKLTRENEKLKAETDNPDEPAEEEEAGREIYKISDRQYPRLIALPKDFAATLGEFRTHVSRAAMKRLGRMGAAEDDAFNFLKKIKAFENDLVLEARVCDRYRLLFCLLPKYIRVVGFVFRPELDKFVDHCLVAGLPPVMEFE